MKFLLAAFLAFLIWIIYQINTGSQMLLIRMADIIPMGDKVGHFFVMGFLAYLVNIVMKCKSVRVGPIDLLWGSLIVFTFVFAEEVSQLFIRGRTFSLLDLGSDVLGIWTIGWLAIKTYPYFQRRETQAIRR